MGYSIVAPKLISHSLYKVPRTHNIFEASEPLRKKLAKERLRPGPGIAIKLSGTYRGFHGYGAIRTDQYLRASESTSIWLTMWQYKTDIGEIWPALYVEDKRELVVRISPVDGDFCILLSVVRRQKYLSLNNNTLIMGHPSITKN